MSWQLDDRALGRQRKGELRVAVIDDVVDVEAAAHGTFDAPRVQQHPVQDPIGQEERAHPPETDWRRNPDHPVMNWRDRQPRRKRGHPGRQQVAHLVHARPALLHHVVENRDRPGERRVAGHFFDRIGRQTNHAWLLARPRENPSGEKCVASIARCSRTFSRSAFQLKP